MQMQINILDSVNCWFETYFWLHVMLTRSPGWEQQFCFLHLSLAKLFLHTLVTCQGLKFNLRSGEQWESSRHATVPYYSRSLLALLFLLHSLCPPVKEKNNSCWHWLSESLSDISSISSPCISEKEPVCSLSVCVGHIFSALPVHAGAPVDCRAAVSDLKLLLSPPAVVQPSSALGSASSALLCGLLTLF